MEVTPLGGTTSFSVYCFSQAGLHAVGKGSHERIFIMKLMLLRASVAKQIAKELPLENWLGRVWY